MSAGSPRASPGEYLASHVSVLTYVEIAASLILSNVVCKLIWHILCFYMAGMFLIVEVILNILLWLGCVRLGADGRPALMTDIDSLMKRARRLVGWDTLKEHAYTFTAKKVSGQHKDVAVRLSFPADSSVASLHPTKLIKELTKGLCDLLSVTERRIAVYNSSPSRQQQISMYNSAVKNQQPTAGITSGKLARLLGLGGGKKSTTEESTNAEGGRSVEESRPVDVDVVLRAARYSHESTAEELFEKLREAFDGGRMPPPFNEVSSMERIKPQHNASVATNLAQQQRSSQSETRSAPTTNVAGNTSNTPGGNVTGEYESSEQKGADAELAHAPKVSFASNVQFSDAETKQQAGGEPEGPAARLWFNLPHSEVDTATFNSELSEELAKLLNAPKSRFEPSLLAAASPSDHAVANLSFIQGGVTAGASNPSGEELFESLREQTFSKLDKKQFPLCSSIQQVGDQSALDPPAGARVGFKFPYSDITRETFGEKLAGDLASLLGVPTERIRAEPVPCSDPLASVFCDITFLGAKEGTDEPTALSLLQTLRAYNFEEAGLSKLLSGVRSVEPFGSDADLDQPESGCLKFTIGYDDISHDFLPTVIGQLAEFLNEPSRRIVASFPTSDAAEDNDLETLKRVNGSAPVLLNLLIAGASGPNERRAVEIADTIECADFGSAPKPLSDVESFDRLEFVDEPLLTRMGFGIGYGQIKDPEQFLAMLRGDLGTLLDVDEKRVTAHLPGLEEKLAEKAKRDAKLIQLEELVGTIGDTGGANVRGMRAKADLVVLREEMEAADKEQIVAEVRFEAAQSRHERPTSVILAELETTNFAYCGSPILSKLKTLESFGRQIEEEPLVARLNFEQTFAEIEPEAFKAEMIEQVRAALNVPAERFEFFLPQVGGDIKPHHKVHSAVKLLPAKNVQDPGVHELFEALRKRRAQHMPTVTSVDYADPAAARKKYGTLGKKKWKRHDLSANKKPPRNFTYADARGGVLPLFKVDKGARERLVSQGVYKRESMRRGKERVVGE